MKTLRDPRLRSRDIHRLYQSQAGSIVWDEGPSERNEWAIASVACDEAVKNLRLWLHDKNIAPDSEALCFDSDWSSVTPLKWAKVLDAPEEFRLIEPRIILSLDFDWLLEFNGLEVARFGRWPNNEQKPG